MQMTGWTIHSPFLVLFGLKKNFTLDVITRGQATTIFLCIGPFSAWWRTNEQPGVLVQACCWPLWEGSLLQKFLKCMLGIVFIFWWNQVPLVKEVEKRTLAQEHYSTTSKTGRVEVLPPVRAEGDRGNWNWFSRRGGEPCREFKIKSNTFWKH